MKAPILMYHRIGEPRKESIVSGQYVPASLFDRHLRFLSRRGYQLLHLGDFTEALSSNRGKPLAVTFDDGYESVHSAALPALAANKAAATVFVVAGQVGKTNAWDEAKGDVTERVMSADQLRGAQAGGIEIGSHTLTHCDLAEIDVELAKREIAESKRVLEDIGGRSVDWFSYPYGRETDGIRGLVRSAGYRGACGTARALNTPSTDVFSLARINVRASTSVTWLIYKLWRAGLKT